MMYSLPIYPHFSPRRYSYYPHPVNINTGAQSNMRKANNPSDSPFNNIYKNDRTNNFANSLKNTKNKKADDLTETSISSEKDDTIFEIFGIKLHSDDILLICLIFFLFKEGVQDEYLFISLILLLLS